VSRPEVCALGHKSHSYECPACAEERGATTTLERWRWFRTRTSSKRIRGEIDDRLADATFLEAHA
jgi:hypothetical protein